MLLLDTIFMFEYVHQFNNNNNNNLNKNLEWNLFNDLEQNKKWRKKKYNYGIKIHMNAFYGEN